MSGIPNKHTLKNWLKVIIPIVVLLIVATLAFTFCKHEEPKEPQIVPTAPIKVDHKQKQVTTFEYLPKAVDQTTGVREDTDVEFTTKQAPLVVNVNGKRHELATDNVKEEHKLDNGKLVVTEVHEAVLDLTVPEQPRFKKGIYVETDFNNDKAITAGARLSYQTPKFDVDLKADLYSQKEHMKRTTLTATGWF